MEKTFAVIGLGTFGLQLCNTLAAEGVTVIAIDNDAALVERVSEVVTQAVLLDATDPDALTGAPLENVDVAIVAIGSQIEASILATALLKRRVVPYIIARAISDLHHQVLRQLGANEVINIEVDEGIRLARRLVSPDVLSRFPISKDMSVAELYVPETIAGASLVELDLRGRYGVNVVSVKRIKIDVDEFGTPQRREEVSFPGPKDRLERDDTILIIGLNKDIERFRNL